MTRVWSIVMSLPAVRDRIPLGAGFLENYHVSPLALRWVEMTHERIISPLKTVPFGHTQTWYVTPIFSTVLDCMSRLAFHASVRGSVPGLGGLKETKMFLPHPRVKVSIVGSLRDREVACPASDRQGSNFESCVWRTVSSQSSHHPQEVLLAQFSLYVHTGGLKPDSFHFCMSRIATTQLSRHLWLGNSYHLNLVANNCKLKKRYQ